MIVDILAAWGAVLFVVCTLIVGVTLIYSIGLALVLLVSAVCPPFRRFVVRRTRGW